MVTVLNVQATELHDNTLRITLDIRVDVENPEVGAELEIGEGPTGTAVPDAIVRFLLERYPSDAGLAEIRAAVGGNPATVNRQAWTLANNTPDLQHRLRGWVEQSDRGRYRISEVARMQRVTRSSSQPPTRNGHPPAR